MTPRYTHGIAMVVCCCSQKMALIQLHTQIFEVAIFSGAHDNPRQKCARPSYSKEQNNKFLGSRSVSVDVLISVDEYASGQNTHRVPKKGNPKSSGYITISYPIKLGSVLVDVREDCFNVH
jgi:hypothetical protein